MRTFRPVYRSVFHSVFRLGAEPLKSAEIAVTTANRPTELNPDKGDKIERTSPSRPHTAPKTCRPCRRLSNASEHTPVPRSLLRGRFVSGRASPANHPLTRSRSPRSPVDRPRHHGRPSLAHRGDVTCSAASVTHRSRPRTDQAEGRSDAQERNPHHERDIATDPQLEAFAAWFADWWLRRGRRLV